MGHIPLRAAALAAGITCALAAPAAAAPNNNTSEKLRSAVTVEGIRSHLEAFQTHADLAGGNRFAGLEGHDRSARYVMEQLRAAGYEPQVHAFTYDAFFERTPSTLQQHSPTPATYTNGNDFRIMSYSGSGDVTAPLATPSGNQNGCSAADFAGFPAGEIALVQRGACTFRLKTDNATAAGASAILIYNHIPGVINGTLSATGLSAIPSLGLTKTLGESLRAQTAGGPVVMQVMTDTAAEPLETYNVFAETAGGDPGNVVMIGGHLDSVTAGPGINDNGSGSAAILETAIQMAKVKPRNKVRFAWWSAEESGLIGARRYVEGLSTAQREDIAAYLNFDMIGSPNYVRFVYDGDGSANPGSIPAGCAETRCAPGSDVIESLFNGYFRDVAGLPAEPTPFNGRSDYGPFIDADIPAGGLFTGAEGIKTAEQAATYGGTAGQAYDPCYHAVCDDIGNLSNAALGEMSDAMAHVLITLAQNTEVLDGEKGKGNFKSPAQAEGGAGTGGGGGLHDEHEHEEA